MGDDEAPPYAEADSNDEMPGGAAGTTPKASPTVPPGEATTTAPDNERLSVASFVAVCLSRRPKLLRRRD